MSDPRRHSGSMSDPMRQSGSMSDHMRHSGSTADHIRSSGSAAGDDPVLGVDLGTSCSCAAVYMDGKVKVISSEDGSRVMPSYISFTETGRKFASEAYNQIGRQPANRLFDMKCFLGHQRCDSVRVAYLSRLLPFRISSSQNRAAVEISCNGNTERYLVEEILAMQFSYLKNQAESFLKMSIKRVVIGIPCSFNTLQREAVRDAAKIAGLTVLRMYSEPGLAACAFLYKHPVIDQTNGIVIDVGGGHCSVAVVTLEKQMVAVQAVLGKADVGGRDFTNRLLEHVLQDIESGRQLNLHEEPRALCRLLVACEKAKKILSTNQKTEVLVEALSGDFDYQVSITREIFEQICADLFDQIIQVADTAVREAGWDKPNIEQIILTGGSTRIPALQAAIQTYFGGKTLNRQINPDEAVAEGAAIVGALLGHEDIYSDSLRNLLLLDVIPFTLGLETVGNSMATVVHRNKPFPSSQTEEFKPVLNAQGGYLVQLYEGESGVASDNVKLAQLLMLNQSSAVVDLSRCQLTQFDDRKDSSLNVTISVEPDMQVTLSAEDHNAQRSGITMVTGLSEEDISHMVQRAENLRNDESVNMLLAQRRNQLEKMTYIMQSQSQTLSEAAKQVLTWLEANPLCGEKALEQQHHQMTEMCHASINVLSSLLPHNMDRPNPSSLPSHSMDRPNLSSLPSHSMDSPNLPSYSPHSMGSSYLSSPPYPYVSYPVE